jgi:hypothetical protein
MTSARALARLDVSAKAAASGATEAAASVRTMGIGARTVRETARIAVAAARMPTAFA